MEKRRINKRFLELKKNLNFIHSNSFNIHYSNTVSDYPINNTNHLDTSQNLTSKNVISDLSASEDNSQISLILINII